MKKLLLPLLILTSWTVNTQIPSTNIYLFDYRISADESVVLSNPQLLTTSNSEGYNNQPRFFDDDVLYFTRQLEGEEQTDLISLNLDKEEELRFTKTDESEYSPTPMKDGESLSCIRVEMDGVQVLWQYPLDRSHQGQRIFPHVQDIGYHFWISDTEAIMFIVSDPIKMILANLENSNTTTLASKIGRCFGEMPDGRPVFVYKYTDDIWHIKILDPQSGRASYLAETVKGSEDFVVLPSGDIIMAKDSKLYKNGGTFTSWKEISDLSDLGISGISRLAYRNGQLALVAN